VTGSAIPDLGREGGREGGTYEKGGKEKSKKGGREEGREGGREDVPIHTQATTGLPAHLRQH